jgi:hypothetical protein
MVMRKRGRITVDVHSAGDRLAADICLTLITSNPRSTSPSEMSSARVVNELAWERERERERVEE